MSDQRFDFSFRPMFANVVRIVLLLPVVVLSSSSLFCVCAAIEPNPPVWPPSVSIFDPSTPAATQAALDAMFSLNGGHTPPLNGQFSSSRFAVLFLPGHHAVTANIGYYTTLAGLGRSPQDTTIDCVQVENGDFDYTVGALDNFWRSAENFHTVPTQTWNGVPNSMLWAVSQSSPLRSVSVDGNLALYEYNSGCCAGYASGGFLADSVVSGTIYSGSQQQWISRNVQMGKWDGGVWNQVFVGSAGGVPVEHCSNSGGLPYSVEAAAPVIAEKPYIIYEDGKFSLVIPPVENVKIGASNGRESWPAVGFESVYVASPNDTAGAISAKIAGGMHIVFSPGIYYLEGSIVVTKNDVVLLGLGMATLVSGGGQPVILVADGVDGVRIAALLIEAGTQHSPSLLSIGASSSFASPTLFSVSSAIVLSDVFFRVGGATNSVTAPVSATLMLHVAASNVIIDNTWLWRADHDIQGSVINGNNPVSTGLLVDKTASNVTAYGLAAEHTLQDLVVWQGANGKVFFYQSEFPYDVTAAYGQQNYSAYRVAASASNHYAVGIGAYCYFRDYVVSVLNGFVSEADDSQMRNPLTVFLSGNGGIEHVWNGKGSAVSAGGQSEYICQGKSVSGVLVHYHSHDSAQVD